MDAQQKLPDNMEEARKEDLPPWQMDWPLGFVGPILEETAEQGEEGGMEETEKVQEGTLGRKRVQLQKLVERLGIEDLVVIKPEPMTIDCPRCGESVVLLKECGSTLLPTNRFIEGGEYHYHDPNWHNQKFECVRCAKVWHLLYIPRCPNWGCEYGGETNIVESS
jgi:hypothetical protein